MRLSVFVAFAVVFLNTPSQGRAQTVEAQACQSPSAAFSVICPTQWQVRAFNNQVLDLFNFQPSGQTNKAPP